ncbi:uncharacterized protein LOC123707030 [Pieris brassicae]|uniref:uncharacterized protein LOC123707030 n=1 Tax=Pieris brassicae TaxID=7116 RepID=UPI001E65F8A3|nr:uncharacterized protein LOC123707030 [Pieris brassicae]
MLLVPDFFLPIELLLQTLVDQYLKTSYCTTVITETPLKILPQISHRYILLNQSLGDLILDASEAGCSDFIVQISEPKRFFSALDYAIHRGLLRRSDRKIILLPSNNTEDNSLLDVLRMKESSFVVNLLLVLPSPSTHCETFDLVTHKFIGPVENDMPVYLDRWNSCSAFEKHANLFPHDMSKLDGKIVKVTCFTYTPYVLLDLEAEIVPLGRDGVEIRLMDEFCR